MLLQEADFLGGVFGGVRGAEVEVLAKTLFQVGSCVLRREAFCHALAVETNEGDVLDGVSRPGALVDGGVLNDPLDHVTLDPIGCGAEVGASADVEDRGAVQAVEM